MHLRPTLPQHVLMWGKRRSYQLPRLQPAVQVDTAVRERAAETSVTQDAGMCVFMDMEDERATAVPNLLLLLLSRFSRVRLLATPWTAAYQAPPSMGVSRQESWSGLPLPSPSSKPTPLETAMLLLCQTMTLSSWHLGLSPFHCSVKTAWHTPDPTTAIAAGSPWAEGQRCWEGTSPISCLKHTFSLPLPTPRELAFLPLPF